jgi:hypothetical protein
VLRSPAELYQVVSLHAPCPYSEDSIELTSNQATNTLHSSIQILNDDVLLNVFYLYRLDIMDEEDEGDRQRWWYKLVQVSRKWRYLILASPMLLDIHLLCSYGVHVADMLAHYPSLPLTIWYTNSRHEMTVKDEQGALLALSHRDRVRRISLYMPALRLRKLISAMDETFPNLEYICIGSRPGDFEYQDIPKTFQAPRLRHVWTNCRFVSPLVTNVAGLVNLELIDIPPWSGFLPSSILAHLSLMPQLTTLRIHFHSPHATDVETPPAATLVTLPNLQVFSYRGVSAYLEGLARIRAPTLNVLDVQFFHQRTFTTPHLLQFMRASEILRFDAVKITFDENFFDLMAGPDPSWQQRSLRLQIMCKHLDLQVASAVQIFDSISPVLSGVEDLVLFHAADPHVKVHRTQWRRLLRPFRNVKSLGVPDTLSGRLSHSLCPTDAEMLLELLPNLLVLQHLGGSGASDLFTLFIHERQAAGRSVHLVTPSSYIPWQQRHQHEWPQLQQEKLQLQQGQLQLQQEQLQMQKEQLQLQQEQLQLQQEQLQLQQECLQLQLQREQLLLHWDQT